MALWDKIGSSGNVEDRRGMSGGLVLSGGAAIVLFLAYAFLGGTPAGDLVGQIIGQTSTQQSSEQPAEYAGRDSYEVFASKVLGSNDELWTKKFAEAGGSYEKPKLVLFRGATRSGCGVASSQVGPHYCPADSTIYLDETFFNELTHRLGAKGGDVAEAYVLAHEVGHHVQNQAGTFDRLGSGGRGDNETSVKVELQADCYAGIWAKSIADQGVLEPGEINEAIDAAKAVGDDRIQQQTTGRINPEQWTHGSSAERVDWFNRGYNGDGSIGSCNTFGA